MSAATGVQAKPHWTMDDIDWQAFRPDLVDRETLQAVKAAAMVEHNAADYVTYLKRVFAGDDAMIADIEQWGIEEIQHGKALGRWGEMADPEFDFEDAFARFREGFSVPVDADASIRGSRAGEMIARCVVESGTSSFYSAIRDATDEPVLKQIAANIAGDEFRHYRLFYEGFLKYAPQERPHFFERLKVALTRVQEAEDDELAYAYYCGNVPRARVDEIPYDRNRCSREYNARVLQFYQPQHIRKGVAMIAKAVGIKPTGYVARGAARVLWWGMRARGRTLKPTQNLTSPAFDKAA